MKKCILNILFSLSFSTVFACSCITQKLVDALVLSEFVATAKITKVIPDNLHPEYKMVTIELINVYKGERVTTLYVNTADNSSCEFTLPVNSTWLFFAGKNADGTIGFGACSNSEQIDRQFSDSLRYPKAAGNYRRSIEYKLKVLAYLHDKKINPVNPYKLYPRIEPDISKIFKAVTVKDKEFAIYQIAVGTDLGVQNVKAVKDWENDSLKIKLLAYLRSNLNFFKWDKRTEIPKPTEFTLIFYSYPAEDGYESFISQWDL